MWEDYKDVEPLAGILLKSLGGLVQPGGRPAGWTANPNNQPPLEAFAAMIERAARLPITGRNGCMAISVYHTTITSRDLALTHVKSGNVSLQHKSASECCEDVFYKGLDPQAGALLIHQDKVPCDRCRAKYAAWARDRNAVIIVAAEGRYDKSTQNPTFVFCPGGQAYYA